MNWVKTSFVIGIVLASGVISAIGLKTHAENPNEKLPAYKVDFSYCPEEGADTLSPGMKINENCIGNNAEFPFYVWGDEKNYQPEVRLYLTDPPETVFFKQWIYEVAVKSRGCPYKHQNPVEEGFYGTGLKVSLQPELAQEREVISQGVSGSAKSSELTRAAMNQSTLMGGIGYSDSISGVERDKCSLFE
ncbi:hypothetical protein [Myxosarcina sp. GI1]|uniref:hypothetical protein n=1 Tax=Myxosarcina sp. GI1 TaxID=1541065 RepID=UPI000566F07C|nr:hypothetical protein [Myxosarcina sp. GI1]